MPASPSNSLGPGGAGAGNRPAQTTSQSLAQRAISGPTTKREVEEWHAEDIRLAVTPGVVYTILSLADPDGTRLKGFSIEGGASNEIAVNTRNALESGRNARSPDIVVFRRVATSACAMGRLERDQNS